MLKMSHPYLVDLVQHNQISALAFGDKCGKSAGAQASIAYSMGGENVSKVTTRLPQILAAKLEMLHSNLELLKTVFQTEDLLIRVTRNYHFFGENSQETLKSLIAFWEDLGFRGIELTKFFLIEPSVLTCTSLSPEQRDLICKIGVHKERKMYKYVVSRIKVLEGRIHNLELCGLSPEQALQVVRADPSVLSKSEENIKRKLEFMLNHMELSVDLVAKHPRLFTMSLDKVIRPRFSVLQNMTTQNGAEELNLTRLCGILSMMEARFVARIIQGHPESATLQTVYKNAIVNVSKEVCSDK